MIKKRGSYIKSTTPLHHRKQIKHFFFVTLCCFVVMGCSKTGCGDSEEQGGGTAGTILDTTPPETSINWTGSHSVLREPNLVLPFSANEPDCTFECQLDEGQFEPCESPHTTVALPDGSHQIKVRATDPSGNTDESPAQFSWSIDTEIPSLVFTQTPALVMYADVATFGFESLDTVTYQCRLDSSEPQPCTSPKNYPDLPSGMHVFDVRATDVAGNVSDWLTYEWEVGLLFGDTTQIVASNIGETASVDTADVDQDGDMDVVSISPDRKKVHWHDNDGAENFTATEIATDKEGVVDVAVTDIDDDGDEDVVVVSDTTDSITLYRNDGAQNFTENQIDEGRTNSKFVEIVDIDGDGDLDIVSSSEDNGRILWHENDGSNKSSFTTHSVRSAGESISSLKSGDIDNDGDEDIVLTLNNANKVVWLENESSNNDSERQFTERSVSSNMLSVQSADVADMDQDGDLDVLSSSTGNTPVVWHRNNGDDSFTNIVISQTLNTSGRIRGVDMDDDGDLDIVVSSNTTGQFYWFENVSDDEPLFYPYTFNIDISDMFSSHIVDLDGDGDNDIITGSTNGTEIVWQANRRYDCDRGFTGDDCDECTQDQASGVTCSECEEGWTGPHCATRISVRIETSPLPVTTSQTSSFLFSSNANVSFECALDAEVFFSCNESAVFSVSFDAHVLRVRGQTEGGYQTKIQTYEWYVSSFGDEAIVTDEGVPNHSVHAADLDQDGDSDLLSASSYDDKIIWYENNGLNPVGFIVRTVTIYTDGAESVYSADVDGDGLIDIVSASSKDDRIAWYKNDGQSPPMFSMRAVNTADIDNNSTNNINGDADGAKSVFAIDVDNDGDIDILSASFNDDKVTWYENDGAQDPVFTPHVLNSPDTDGLSGNNGNMDGANSVFGSDLDSDGDIDILATSLNDDKVVWFRNNGVQDFTMEVISEEEDGASDVQAVDMDGDGDIDLISVGYYSDAVTWHENNGQAEFTSHLIASALGGVKALSVGDIDGDSILDIVVAVWDEDSIIIFQNDGEQNFFANKISDSVNNANDVFIADMDNDGDMDILTAGAFGNTMVWYPNQQYSCVPGFTGESCLDCTYPNASGVSCNSCVSGWGGAYCNICLLSNGCD